MTDTPWFSTAVLCALLLAAPVADARGSPRGGREKLDRLNRRLAGQIVDYTHNHGADHRMWSPALHRPRDLYVYLPPGFDPTQSYPFLLWLHGFDEDEQCFLDSILEPMDCAIAAGRLPPFIIAVPDGNLDGRANIFNPVSFYVNSNVGNFEDYIIQDVLGFVFGHYPICPARESHAIVGFSMGGFGAYNIAFKHPELFKTVVGICPPLNMRWVDCHGRYRTKFDPCCWGWRMQVDRRCEVLGRFYGGLVPIHLKRVIDPLFGTGPEALEAVSRENPIEMIDRLGIRDGLFNLYVAYVGRDKYNIHTQVESFLYRARQRGLTVGVSYLPKERHRLAAAVKLLPAVIDWLGQAVPW